MIINAFNCNMMKFSTDTHHHHKKVGRENCVSLCGPQSHMGDININLMSVTGHSSVLSALI